MKFGILPLRLGALFLVFVLFVLSIDAAFAKPPVPNEDELPPLRPTPQPGILTDLATYPANRWIVQINAHDPPVILTAITPMTAVGHVDCLALNENRAPLALVSGIETQSIGAKRVGHVHRPTSQDGAVTE